MIINIGLLVIIAITFVFNSVCANIDDEEKKVTISHSSAKLIGEWYLIAVTSSHYIPFEEDICVKKTFTRDDTDELLQTNTSRIQKGLEHSSDWWTEIDGTKLIIHAKNNEQPEPLVQKFDIYPDSELFVVNDYSQNFSRMIYSRRPFVEETILEPFIKNNDFVQYTNVDLCRIRNESQKTSDEDTTTNLLGEWILTHYLCPDTVCNGTQHTKFFYKLIFSLGDDDNLGLVRHQNVTQYKILPKVNVRVFYGDLYSLQTFSVEPFIYYMTLYNYNREIYLQNSKTSECAGVYTRQGKASAQSLAKYKAIAQEEGWSFLNSEC